MPIFLFYFSFFSSAKFGQLEVNLESLLPLKKLKKPIKETVCRNRIRNEGS
jgi:hypothetical protein